MNIKEFKITKEELLNRFGANADDHIQVVNVGESFEFYVITQEELQLIINLFDLESQKQIEEVISKLYMLGLVWNEDEYNLNHLLNSWNTTSNENAVTMIQLLDAFFNAFTAPKAHGLSIEDMNILTTHMASRTRESGNIIGNALKSILVRIKKDDVIEGLNARNLNVTDNENTMSVLEKIKKYLNEIKDKEKRSNELVDIAKLLGGNYHIARATTILDSN